MTTTHPPLVPSDFDFGEDFVFFGVPLVESEHGEYMYAYGHVDPDTFAAAVDSYGEQVNGCDFSICCDRVETSAVRHLWAVTVEPPPEWRVTWRGITEHTPGAFPITVVARGD